MCDTFKNNEDSMNDELNVNNVENIIENGSRVNQRSGQRIKVGEIRNKGRKKLATKKLEQ